MKEKTGIIDPDGRFIPLNYYDIYDFAKKKCLEYASLSTENGNKFYWFSKEYNTFEPYLDFLLCRLGFMIVNPLNCHNVVECGKNNNIIFKEVDKNLKEKSRKKEIYYKRCNEGMRDIRNFSINIKDSGVILPSGKFITVDRNIYHEDVAIEVINQYLIKNKELYEDFISYITDFYDNKSITISKIGSNCEVIDYLSKYLGCIWFTCLYDSIYNSALLTKETKEIINALKQNSDNYNDDNLPYLTIDNEDIKKYRKIIKNIYGERVHYE